MVETVRRCVCDECLGLGPDALESENPVDLARAEGWKVGFNGEAACPVCITKEAEPKD
jgi:hypothetical protein